MDQNKNAQGTQKHDKASQQNRVHQPADSGAEQNTGNVRNTGDQKQDTDRQDEKNSADGQSER